MSSMRWSVELARRARGVATIGEFRAEVLAVCREVVPFDQAVFAEFHSHEPCTTVDVACDSLALIHLCESSISRYAGDLHKMFQAARDRGGGLDLELYSARERRELPLFRDIIRPQRVRSTVCMVPRWQGVPQATIRLERCDRILLTTRDLERGLQLLPVIELGLAAHRFALARSPPQPLEPLGVRETEVARHVGRGLTTPQIAFLLGTSPLTVRNQISRVFDKVQVASRAELAAWVSRRESPGRPAASLDGTHVPFPPADPPQ